ncbi:hypothetical protein HYPSUDRAFT_48566 [Hypholoma sublateritium FD-334 SS-4]|uniref:Protein BFR2 n=1 Tax=Hypholoma sublateritium (strain FD-334 SS-4) TaxID=945553 RepID=A0A0D2P444_HYPSF|nr:hypothetical protein HYPSUDRAFT_48566 [Hypholoma sublateritium FD-334 SS-4]
MAPERLSLAEQIAQLEEAAPADYDPEDLQSRGADDAMDLDDGAVREHYFEVGPSTLRNKLPSVADAKYEGIRVSRKQLLEDEEEGSDEDKEEEQGRDGLEEGASNDEDDLDSDDQGDGGSLQGSHDHIFERRLPSASEESDGDSESEGEKPLTPEHLKQGPADQALPDDVTSTLQKTRENDIKKGQAVKRQIALWDTLLDTRIRLQKSVVSANALPPPAQMKEYLETSSCRDAISKFLNEAAMLTDELSQLQENILTTNKVIQPPPKKRRKLDGEPSFDQYKITFETASEDLSALEHAFHPHLLQTLSKWSAKIQAVAPSVLLPSNRGAFSKGGQNLKSAVELVEETLHDQNKLLTRTQIPRVKKPRIGGAPVDKIDHAEVVDADVFDDTDFYQKILRDIIDARGDGSKNDDWMLLQKQKKAKKKVDTKASKGRKLRYEVHEKLQNFMVPVPVPGAWHEEQIDELFASLLGKGFENIALNAEQVQVQNDIQLGGFRVFG